MRIYHSRTSTAHDPKTFLRRGVRVAHPESIERYELLRRAVVEAGYDLREAPDQGADPLYAVHTRGYLEFLRSSWSRRAEIDSSSEIESIGLVPNIFARQRMLRRPEGLRGLLG